jgi:hypothetical protein
LPDVQLPGTSLKDVTSISGIEALAAVPAPLAVAPALDVPEPVPLAVPAVVPLAVVPPVVVPA